MYLKHDDERRRSAMKERKMSKDEAWDYALGMIRVDGLEPTSDFLELVEREKRGEMTREDIKKVLDTKYRVKTAKTDAVSF
jgi:hypothetical protein